MPLPSASCRAWHIRRRRWRRQHKLETRGSSIPSVDPGIELYMRNKHPAGMTTFSADRTLLFVHGATYPAETAFDLPIEGESMMDLIAQQGYDVFLVDIRGYGGSTRPPEMDQPAAANKPVATSADAAKDLGAAVDYVLKTRSIPKLDLMGWSWGTSTAGILHVAPRRENQPPRSLRPGLASRAARRAQRRPSGRLSYGQGRIPPRRVG